MKVLSFTPQDAINAKAHRKENGFREEHTVIALNAKDNLTPIILRLYCTGSTWCACLWIYSKQYATGSGRASGYDKPSAAAGEAISKAGIKLSESIDGRGDTAIRSALEAIASHLGYKKIYIHRANA